MSGRRARAVEISTASVPFQHTIARLMQNRTAFENPRPPISGKFIRSADGTIATAAVGKSPGSVRARKSSSALEFEQFVPPPEKLLRIACQNPPPGAEDLPLSNPRRPNLSRC